MISFALFFTLGVWYLQQQAALPDLPFYWPLPLLVLLLPRPAAGVLVHARRVLILLSAVLLGYGYAAWMAQHRLADGLPDAWQGKNIVITGIVAEMPRELERGLRFTFDVDGVKTAGAHVPHRILLSTYDGESKTPLHPAAGQRWQLTVRLKQPHGTSNPGNFDFEAWALERNIRATGYVYEKGDNLSLAEETISPAYFVQHLREIVRSHFHKTLGEAPYTGILTALAIGDQSGIGEDSWQLFTRTGTNHLMSISGMHITLLAGMIFGLVYWLWQRSTRLALLFPARKAAALCALAAALFYTLASGYEVPAQRTLYMVATFTAMLLLSRNVSPSQMLAAALLVVLLGDPWAVLSPGFWLSFGAVALIFYVTANRLRKEHWLKEYGKVQWAMTIGLIPPLLALFQQLSLIAPLANAFAIPLVSLLVVPLALLGTLPPFEWMLYLAHQAMTLCIYLLQLLDRVPYAVWLQHAPPVWTVLAGVAGALWLLAPRGFPMRWLGGLLLLPMFLVAPPAPAPGTARITVFDVGQGMAVSVQTARHALLYDTGPDFGGEADSGNRILLPALRRMGIASLDLLVLSHDDADHIGGTESILRGMPVTNIFTPLPRTHRRLALAAHSERCHDGQSWEWEGVRFEMLHPPETAGSGRDNELGCVLRIETGEQSILLAADIESGAEQRLLAMHHGKLPATVLVAPHHGSKSSSSEAFVAAVHPAYVVFTNGYRNRFGHPDEAVVARYRAAGSTTLRSDEEGAVTITLSAAGSALESQRRSRARYWQHGQSPSA
jgi:competence protein ComEC